MDSIVERCETEEPRHRCSGASGTTEQKTGLTGSHVSGNMLWAGEGSLADGALVVSAHGVERVKEKVVVMTKVAHLYAVWFAMPRACSRSYVIIFSRPLTTVRCCSILHS